MNRILWSIYCLVITACVFFTPGTLASDETQEVEQSDSAVVFVYHRIGQDDFVRSNLSLESFRQHIALINTEKYNVLPLAEITERLDNGAPLPENAIALTFNGAYTATLDNAISLLVENDLPFTLFFSSARIDHRSTQFMSWRDLRRLKKTGLASFGIMPANYLHLAHQDNERIREEINTALSRTEKELEIRPSFFAYPYGEYSKSVQEIVAGYDFDAVFGQHGGAISKQSDRLALPRFSLTDGYASADRFELTARTLPLPLTDITPDDHYIAKGVAPQIGFTVDDTDIGDLDRLSCFASDIGRIDLIRLEGQRFEIRFETLPAEGRLRINCTLPYKDKQPGEDPRWHWFGMMFTIGDAGGSNTAGDEF
ncbi:MAG: polysaccharide deacetylase family protein [Pseudomonadota bacterium]